jgi:tetratricopeptide (TPR) repeat protein
MRSFVGRGLELGDLRASLADAIAGHGQLVFLVGEPGIGKTRTAEELATFAAENRVAVLWGRCWEQEGAPAFWPWVQVLRAALGLKKGPALRRAAGEALPHVLHLVPELQSRFPDVPPPGDLESARGRFQLFDAVAALLKALADSTPLLLILDDVHWADHASLQLSQFLAHEIRSSRMLIVATYRDVDVNHNHPLAHTLIALTSACRCVELRGLSRAEVSTLIKQTASLAALSPEVVADLHERTGGNPFFVQELLRTLVPECSSEDSAGGSLSPSRLPRSIRNAVRQRLLELSPRCQQLLTRAAVLGPDFEPRLLEAVYAEQDGADDGLRHSEFLGWLDEAEQAGLLVRSGQGRHRYAHSLVRETLYDGLGSADRVRLHRAVGAAIEALYDGQLDLHVAELAHHFARATEPDTAERAIHYAMRAGDSCMQLLAFEDATQHYRMALQTLESQTVGQTGGAEGVAAIRCRLLLALGNALMRAGDRPKARDTYLRAAENARRTGDALALSHAALGYAGFGDVTAGDSRVVGLLEEAREALGTRPATIRVRVLSRLASALYFSEGRERSATLSQEALTLARELGDPATLAYALAGRHFALWAPDTPLQERLATAAEIVQLAEQAGKRDLALVGRVWRIIDLLEQCDVATAAAEIEAFGRLATDSHEAFQEWQAVSMRAMLATMQGRLGDAEQLVQEAFSLGQRAKSPNAGLRLGTQLFWLRRLQGRLDELAPTVAALCNRYPNIPAIHVGLAVIHSETGDARKARQEFDRLAVEGFRAMPRDGTWISSMAQMADVCAALGDVDQAAVLYEALAPHAERAVVISFAYACDGSLKRHLGRLATVLHRWHDAERQLLEAIAHNIEMGARPLAALARYAYAEMLLSRRASGDSVRAREVLSAARATFEDLGMSSYRERADHLLQIEAAPIMPPRAQQESAPVHAPPPNQFRKEGDSWAIEYAGISTRMYDAKGLRYLAHLLREPGREFHVADLIRAVSGEMTESGTPGAARLPAAMGEHARATAVALTPPDARAKGEYRRRLDDLRATADEAERFNDPVRAATARAEIESITAELQAAYGLYGARRTGAPAEKMRKAVSNCVRDVLRKLQRQHEPLWRHLYTSVRTGTFCSYQPEHPTSWRVID